MNTITGNKGVRGGGGERGGGWGVREGIGWDGNNAYFSDSRF